MKGEGTSGKQQDLKSHKKMHILYNKDGGANTTDFVVCVHQLITPAVTINIRINNTNNNNKSNNDNKSKNKKQNDKKFYTKPPDIWTPGIPK